MSLHNNSNKDEQLGINTLLPLFTRLQFTWFSHAPFKIKLVSAQVAPVVMWDGQRRLHQRLPHHCVVSMLHIQQNFQLHLFSLLYNDNMLI